jgi:hypothetical protein
MNFTEQFRMDRLKYFFECYFNQTYSFGELDGLIQEFKKIESEECKLLFIRELHLIIQTKSYDFAAKIMKKYGDRILKVEKAEKLVTYLYDKLLDKSTVIKGSDFTKDCKVVFCPICCPDPEVATKFSLIEKAIIIKNGAQIYICKPCKLVWFDPDDIRTENAQSYKKFMKTLGLKGLWKELSKVDTL